MFRLSRSVLDALGAVVRLGLAAVFLVSGAIKVLDPAQTRVAVGGYELLPADLVGPVATGLPLVELAVGTLLVLGATTRWVALAAGVLLLMLMAAVAQAWARGLSIDCGCFGGGGAVATGDTRYPQELARDAGFVLLAVWLLMRPRTALSIDSWIRAGSRSGWGRAGHPAG
ncbi:MAG TPA: MauE/DoxX family redox-associated membrane protein [Pseudonocardiaceae bacterium]|nr:MauE/DoxX family redox-associated membrane protein [Pseudonocardiaceae bacterium]